MKLLQCIIAALAAVTITLTGCQKSGVDTRPLEKSFSTADPSTKASSDQAVSAIKSGNYSAAMAELGKLGQQAKLTPEQQSAIKDTLDQVKKQLADTADRATKEMKKGIDDVQKSLKK